MLLTIDIGNTNIKSALFDNNIFGEYAVHSHVEDAIEYINGVDFTKAAICSVNPINKKILADTISNKSIKLFCANIKNKFNLNIKYETPESLGMDRVCSAAGALSIASNKLLFKKNQYIITIDFGTATTINIISPNGYFIGGLIAPGVVTMLKSLNEKTAQLPLPELENYEGAIGNSTNASMISGVYTATIGVINETVNQISEMDSKTLPLIFCTGGNAKFILPHLRHNLIFEEALVLKGLKVIYDLNN